MAFQSTWLQVDGLKVQLQQNAIDQTRKENPTFPLFESPDINIAIEWNFLFLDLEQIKIHFWLQPNSFYKIIRCKNTWLTWLYLDVGKSKMTGEIFEISQLFFPTNSKVIVIVISSELTLSLWHRQKYLTLATNTRFFIFQKDNSNWHAIVLIISSNGIVRSTCSFKRFLLV